MGERIVIGMSGTTPTIWEGAMTSGAPGLTKRSQVIWRPMAALGSEKPRVRAAFSLITTVGWTLASG